VAAASNVLLEADGASAEGCVDREPALDRPAGDQEIQGIEGSLDLVHDANRTRAALEFEELQTRDADPVLPGDRSTQVDRRAVEPAASAAPAAASSSASAAAPGRSDSISSRAAASGSSRWNASLTARIVTRSISSKVQGTRPAAVMRSTASPAPSVSSKKARR